MNDNANVNVDNNQFSISTKSTTITDMNGRDSRKDNVKNEYKDSSKCEISKLSNMANNLRTENINITEVVDNVCEDDNKLFLRRNSQSILSIKNRDRTNYTSFTSSVFSFKFVLIGDVSVGKTCIKWKLTDNIFNENYRSTIGADFKSTTFKLTDSNIANIQVWDTCGQEKFKSLTKQYYRDAQGIFLVFDITDKKTFDNIEGWIFEINSNLTDTKSHSFILVGNKSDLSDLRQVNEFEAIKFAAKYDMEYLEVSAKTGHNIGEIFETMCYKVIDRQEQELMVKPKLNIQSSISDDKNMSFQKLMNTGNKKKSCC